MKKILLIAFVVLGWQVVMADTWTDPRTGITWTYTVVNNTASVGVDPTSTGITGAIEIPATINGHSVTSIGGSAFEECSGLTEVKIQDGVESIGRQAFYFCDGLRELTIPSSVTNIGTRAFGYCHNLRSVTFLGNAPVYDGGDMDSAFTGSPNDLRIHVNTDSDGWVQWSGRSVYFDNGIGQAGEETPLAENAVLTITNVVIHYIVQSVNPEKAIPASYDTGFVNIITEVTSGGAVSVPATWMMNYPTYITKFGNDFTKSLMKPTGKVDAFGNSMLVWQDYVAGTDPTDENDVFTASITMVGGQPVISYTPELDDARKALRKYTTYGKVDLSDENWVEVADADLPNYHFFKVTVEMK